MESLEIAFVISELTPFAKTGGLADVGDALPRALAKMGHDVRVFVPLYGSIDREAYGLEKRLDADGFSLFEGVLKHSEVPVYFVDAPRWFARESIYTNDPDEPSRFAMFCHAVLQSCQRIPFAPRIFHINDWQTALVPLLLQTSYAWDRLFDGAKTFLSIHNLGYQGVFSNEPIEGLEDIDRKHFDAQDESAGVVNFLKTGILYADHLSTVSPTYAREIQTEEQGFGLDALLRSRASDLTGILNGVDYEDWSPESDPHIPFRYSVEDVAPKKKKNRDSLAEQLSLSIPDEVPLVGMVTRLSAQKGIDLLPEVLPEMLAEDQFALVVLGTGEKSYESFFASLESRFPGRVCFYRGFHNALAHFIEAASDIFLMPSRYEPCGLNQMYSLRYGTVPVVRKTGGLADSVLPFDPSSGEGTGIVFDHYTAAGLRWALEMAVRLYRDAPAWSRLVDNGMSRDFSWAGPAVRYSDIYRQLLIH